MAMDMNQTQRARMETRQEQVMTHQQIQALEMLNAPALELQALVRAEIEKNPVLETSLEEDMPDRNETATHEDEWLEKILKLDDDARYIKSFRFSLTQEEEDRRRQFLEAVAVPKSFQETLLEQLRFLDLDPKLAALCEVVVSGLDDQGYLKAHPADLAMAAGQKLDAVTRAIAIVKQLDPPGVAAADLRERLLIQLERRGDSASVAYTVVRDHLDDLASNQLPKIARKLKIDIEELKDAIDDIQCLNPRLHCEEPSHEDYVSEEVSVVEDEDGKLKVKLNNEYLPALRISKNYKRILADPSASKETKDYIKEKIKAGVGLINSIIQRQTTIQKIVGAIVEQQQEYFANGPDFLKPLTMSTIAEKAGVHETTVSRAVASKHLRCKHGVIPIRGLFSGGYDNAEGEAVSRNVVVDRLRELIAGENRGEPLSDIQLSEMLKGEGYNVARRTVAKYRETINILPSNLRREY